MSSSGALYVQPSVTSTFTVPERFADGVGLIAPAGGQNNQNTGTLMNGVITSQDNPTVNAIQFGIDTVAASLKEQHVTTQRATDLGPGANLTMNPGGAIGNNQAGAATRIASGASTGNVAGGFIAFAITTAGAAGATVNGFVDRFYMADVAGFSVFYPAAINNGFLGLSSNHWFEAYIDTLNVFGGAGFWGHAPPGAQPAAPVTLADVIAIIRGCGLSA